MKRETPAARMACGGWGECRLAGSLDGFDETVSVGEADVALHGLTSLEKPAEQPVVSGAVLGAERHDRQVDGGRFGVAAVGFVYAAGQRDRAADFADGQQAGQEGVKRLGGAEKVDTKGRVRHDGFLRGMAA